MGALERHELDDGDGAKDRAPKRDDVSDVRVEPHDIEADDQRARNDGDAHLTEHVLHRPAMRYEIAPSRCQGTTYRAPRDDGGGKQETCRHDDAPFGIEREHDARRHQRDENESAGEPPHPAMPSSAPLEPARHEQEAKGERNESARHVNA